MEGEYPLGNEQKELQHLLQGSTTRGLAHTLDKVASGAILAGAVTATVGYNFVFPAVKRTIDRIIVNVADVAD
jgi:hypothetical protein